MSMNVKSSAQLYICNSKCPSTCCCVVDKNSVGPMLCTNDVKNRARWQLFNGKFELTMAPDATIQVIKG